MASTLPIKVNLIHYRNSMFLSLVETSQDLDPASKDVYQKRFDSNQILNVVKDVMHTGS